MMDYILILGFKDPMVSDTFSNIHLFFEELHLSTYRRRLYAANRTKNKEKIDCHS